MKGDVDGRDFLVWQRGVGAILLAILQLLVSFFLPAVQ